MSCCKILLLLCGVSYLSHGFIGEFRRPVEFTVLMGSSSLECHIPRIIGGTSFEKVFRIDAWRDIATVADVHAFGDRTVRNFEGNTVRAQHFPIDRKSSVSEPKLRSRPDPTAIGTVLINLAPEARERARIVFSHDDLPGRCGQDSCAVGPALGSDISSGLFAEGHNA